MTHGILDENSPLYSGLVLSPTQGSDGFLHAYEIFPVALDAELVVLSACETAGGELRAGEGVLALTRAFMAAGARSVVASLWLAPDVAGPLMPEFYRGLMQGASKAAALRAAKLAMKSSRGRVAGQEVSYAHPIFWASSVLVGSPD